MENIFEGAKFGESTAINAYKAGCRAAYQQNIDINKACEWLEEELNGVEDFRKAMA